MIETIKKLKEQNNKEEIINFFEENFNNFMTRKGNELLLEFIQKSDFYTAPASTKFHSSHEGGLLLHSLFVMACLMEKRNSPIWGPVLKKCTDETLFLVSVCHDLCKTYFYAKDFKNQKLYDDNGSQKDAKGRYNWQTVPIYVVNDKYPLGHGEKSCYFLMKFVELSTEEYAAIRWHMGFSEPRELYSAIGNSMDKYPLVLALNEADQEATHIFESEN